MTWNVFLKHSHTFLSYPQCKAADIKQSACATLWNAAACSEEEGKVGKDEMMKGNKTSRQMRQKIHKWNIKKMALSQKMERERERKREREAEKEGSRKEMEAELLGLILIQTGKITGGWIESGLLQLLPPACAS